MKPEPDLFVHMAQRLHLQPQQILHVGDDVTTDVAGAIHNGYRCAWLNDVGQKGGQWVHLLLILAGLELLLYAEARKERYGRTERERIRNNFV